MIARLPLLAAACVALLTALAPPLALGVLPVAWLLALRAHGRVRALAWCAAAAVAAAALAHAAGAPPIALPDDAHGVRRALARPLEQLVAEPEGALLTGIVLGERSSIPRDLALAFQRSGTSHLLAISGSNMTLVAACVALLLRRRLAPALVIALSTAAVCGYALLVGPAASVLRAALMAVLAAVALVRGHAAAAGNGLCAAVAVMLALDPSAVRELSFQLSVAATSGLIVLQRPVASRFSALPPFARDALAATLAATATTMPFVAGAVGRVSIVAPLANLVAVPLFAPVLALGAATALVGNVQLDAARPLALAAWLAATLLRRTAEVAASFPLATVDVPAGAATGAAVAALGVAAALLVRRVRLSLPRARPRWDPPDRRAVAFGAAAILVSVGCAAALAREPADVRFRALDVGQGDAFLIEIGDRLALIDGGPDPARLAAQLGAVLPPWRRRIDVVALTHPHLDHGAGLVDVLARYDVGIALEPARPPDVPLTAIWRDAATRAGVRVRAVGAGDRLALGDATIDVLAPNDDPRDDVRSLVLRLSRGPFSILFTGDATDAALADLLLDAPALRSAVYVPPHHGAETPHARSLVDAVRPRVAVLSVGAANRYGHPAPPTLAALGGIATYRTDRDGTVEIAVDGTKLSVRTHTSGVPPGRGGSVPRAPPSR